MEEQYVEDVPVWKCQMEVEGMEAGVPLRARDCRPDHTTTAATTVETEDTTPVTALGVAAAGDVFRPMPLLD